MSTYYVAGFPVSDELYHHGILGQKWGVRRYQNPDGSLTPAGERRYGLVGYSEGMADKKELQQRLINSSIKARRALNATNSIINNVTGQSKTIGDRLTSITRQNDKDTRNKDVKLSNQAIKERNEKIKKGVKIGLAIAGAGVAAYGAYKITDFLANDSYRNYLQSGRQSVDKMIELHQIDLERQLKPYTRLRL